MRGLFQSSTCVLYSRNATVGNGTNGMALASLEGQSLKPKLLNHMPHYFHIQHVFLAFTAPLAD